MIATISSRMKLLSFQHPFFMFFIYFTVLLDVMIPSDDQVSRSRVTTHLLKRRHVPPSLLSIEYISLSTSILSRNLFTPITTISYLSSSTAYLVPSTLFDSSSTTPSLHHHVVRSSYSRANERVLRLIGSLQSSLAYFSEGSSVSSP